MLDDPRRYQSRSWLQQSYRDRGLAIGRGFPVGACPFALIAIVLIVARCSRSRRHQPADRTDESGCASGGTYDARSGPVAPRSEDDRAVAAAVKEVTGNADDVAVSGKAMSKTAPAEKRGRFFARLVDQQKRSAKPLLAKWPRRTGNMETDQSSPNVWNSSINESRRGPKRERQACPTRIRSGCLDFDCITLGVIPDELDAMMEISREQHHPCPRTTSS